MIHYRPALALIEVIYFLKVAPFAIVASVLGVYVFEHVSTYMCAFKNIACDHAVLISVKYTLI